MILITPLALQRLITDGNFHSASHYFHFAYSIIVTVMQQCRTYIAVRESEILICSTEPVSCFFFFCFVSSTILFNYFKYEISSRYVIHFLLMRSFITFSKSRKLPYRDR